MLFSCCYYLLCFVTYLRKTTTIINKFLKQKTLSSY